MDSRKKLKLNILIGVFNQFIVMITNYLSKQALYRTLGAGYVGIQVVFGSVCDIIVLAFCGIGSTMLVMLYSAISGKDFARESAIYRYFDRISRKLTLVSLGAGLVMTSLVIFVVSGEISKTLVVVYYLFYLLSILILNRYKFNYYFLMAQEEKYLGNLLYSTIDTVAVIAELLVLYGSGSYLAFLFIIIIKNFIESLFLRYIARRKYPFIEEQTCLDEIQEATAQNDMKQLVVSKIGDILIFNTDSMIISRLVSVTVAGLYSNYNFIFMGIKNVIYDIFDSIMVKIGNVNAQADADRKMANHIYISMINIGITALCVSGYVLMAERFITLWMGDSAILTKQVLYLSAAELYIQLQRLSVAVCRQAEGLFKELSKVILIRGVLNIILSVVLGLVSGIFGILAATVISEVVTVYWYEPMVLYKRYKKGIRFAVIYQLLSAAVVLLALLASNSAVNLIPGYSWLTFILQCIVIIAVSAVIGISFFFISTKVVKEIR